MVWYNYSVHVQYCFSKILQLSYDLTKICQIVLFG